MVFFKLVMFLEFSVEKRLESELQSRLDVYVGEVPLEQLESFH